MPTLPSKEELESMMYRDLQKICKDWGVRANLKSDEMIDLLLEAQSKMTPPVAAAPLPPVQQRSVSTRHSSRAVPSRTTSFIIHDIPNATTQQYTNPVNASSTNADIPVVPARPVRTKKAKELQRRLGVGRPVAVGGTGPRAVTRSSTISQERRLRSGRSIKQREATIQEEPEFLDESHPREVSTPSQSQNITPAPQETGRTNANTVIPDYHKLLSEIVKPLQSQIDTLRAEVTRLQRLEAGFHALSTMAAQMGHWEKSSTGEQLPPLRNPSTPPATSNLRTPMEPQALMPSPRITASSPVLLGKRLREIYAKGSMAAEGDDEQEESQGTSGPTKKRPKLSEEGSSNKGKQVTRDKFSGSEEPSTIGDRVASAAMPRATSFIVYNDPDEDTLPLNNLLPDYYTSQSGDSSGSPRQGCSTSSAVAPENRNPFSFSFLPEPSAPGPSLFMPAFPYPEAPQSPTPVGASTAGSLGNTEERTDVFKPFGLPPPDRAGRLPASSSNSTVNPAALSQRNPTVKQRQPSSNEVGAGLGLIPSASRESSVNSGREGPTSGKTMYGTELGADNRFGDFGVEGVAAGFWGGGRF